MREKKGLYYLMILAIVMFVGVGCYFFYDLVLKNYFHFGENNSLVDEDARKKQIQNELKVETIKETILNNAYLSDEEKELFLSVPQVFIDQVDYYNFDKVINQLKNLQVTYRGDIDRVGDTVGEYDYEKNMISIYGVNSFSKAPKAVLTHEFLHVFTDFSNDNEGKVFYETLTVIMNNEYYGNDYTYDNAYSWFINYAYVLGEILGTDLLRRYHSNTDVNTIVERLMSIINNEEKARKLIELVKYFNRNVKSKEDQKVLDEKKRELETLLIEYYETKFSLKMKASLYLSYFFNQDIAYRSIAKHSVRDTFTANYFDLFVEVKDYRHLFVTSEEDNYLTLKVCTKAVKEKNVYSKEDFFKLENNNSFKKRIVAVEITPEGNYKVEMVVANKFSLYQVKSFELQ